MNLWDSCTLLVNINIFLSQFILSSLQDMYPSCWWFLICAIQHSPTWCPSWDLSHMLHLELGSLPRSSLVESAGHFVKEFTKTAVKKGPGNYNMSYQIFSALRSGDMRQWTGSSLVQKMPCHLFGTKTLPEPFMEPKYKNFRSRKLTMTAATLFRP